MIFYYLFNNELLNPLRETFIKTIKLFLFKLLNLSNKTVYCQIHIKQNKFKIVNS